MEKRAQGSGYTAQLIQARAAYIASRSGAAELTATVQACVSLWEGGLSMADVDGTDMLSRHTLALAARALALRGEAVFVIDDTRLLPCSDWDLSTRFSRPTAYRVTIADMGGGTTRTALAAEVVHFRAASDVTQPYMGQAPLRRAGLTAALLHHVESALADIYQNAPLGSQIVTYPEAPEVDLATIARSLTGFRGGVQIRESVNVTAAGGPTPQTDWRPSDLTPDLSKAMTTESLDAARGAIALAFGVLPAMLNPAATGPLVREGQRHLAQWMLQPIAAHIAEETTDKLGQTITLDILRPLQAYDAGGRARAAAGIIQALTAAKDAGVDPNTALKLVNWDT